MTSRDEILARVRRHLPASRPLPDVPAFDPVGGLPLVERFEAAAARMGTKVVHGPGDADLTVFVRGLYPQAAVVCSATGEVAGNRDISTMRSPADLDGVDLGVVRAAFGVAETGSIWLTDQELRVDTLGFLPQHMVALLDPAHIVANLHHAYRQRSRFDTRYGVLVSGPSATADIEGVLIHGAQGVRSLTLVLARAR